MEQLNFFPIPFYKFKCENSITKKIITQIKQFSYTHNTENQTVREYGPIDSFFDEELCHWFEQCLTLVKRKHYNDDVNIVITSCWVNKTSFAEKHHRHYHPNSILSGIFYLNTLNHSQTRFFQSDYYSGKGVCKYLDISNKFEHKEAIFPEEGVLVIFPSYIEHDVIHNKSKDERYTISFNSFITGNIGDSNYRTELDINTVSLRERIKPPND